jgi:hypothetical protein
MNIDADLLGAIFDGVFGRRVRRLAASLLLVIVLFGGAGWIVNFEVQRVSGAIQPYVHYLDKQIQHDEHPPK